MALVVVIVCVAACAAVAWGTVPPHVGVGFTGAAPVVARVNAPKPNATEKQRTVELPNGEKYLIREGDRGHFVLVHPWPVSVSVDSSVLDLTVPKLFDTDFASIPRCLHSLLSPLNNTVYAAIVHDFMYRPDAQSPAMAIDRATADRIFYWCMRAKGVSRVTSGAMYIGVRLGGARSYRRPQDLAAQPPRGRIIAAGR